MKKQNLIFLAAFSIIVSVKAQTNTGFKLFGKTITYESGTILLTSINTTLTTLNLAGITPKWQSQYIQGVAIATGAVQLGFGIYDARKNFTTLNLVNITAGVATIITNSLLLYKTLNPGKKFKWKVYYSPFQMNKYQFGISLVKKF